MSKDKWVWMPHPGHFIAASDCKFHLNTAVAGGKYIVSTVGEYFPDYLVREGLAESRGVKLEGMGDARRYDYMEKVGYEDIGLNRKYETMVFKAKKSKHDCCRYEQTSGSNLDFEGYSTPRDAYKGHLKLCAKWDRKKVSK